MKNTVLKLIFSALFWLIMFVASGRLKELFKKDKVESLTADYIEYIERDGKQYLKFTVKNDTSSEVCYNTEGYLSVKHQNEFISIEMKEHHMYSGASYYIAPGDMQEYNICLTDYYDYLSPGVYRYTKPVGCNVIDVDFEIHDKTGKKK